VLQITRVQWKCLFFRGKNPEVVRKISF